LQVQGSEFKPKSHKKGRKERKREGGEGKMKNKWQGERLKPSHIINS
jgi:hypothetical protein